MALPKQLHVHSPVLALFRQRWSLPWCSAWWWFTSMILCWALYEYTIWHVRCEHCLPTVCAAHAFFWQLTWPFVHLHRLQ